MVRGAGVRGVEVWGVGVWVCGVCGAELHGVIGVATGPRCKGCKGWSDTGTYSRRRWLSARTASRCCDSKARCGGVCGIGNRREWGQPRPTVHTRTHALTHPHMQGVPIVPTASAWSCWPPAGLAPGLSTHGADQCVPERPAGQTRSRPVRVGGARHIHARPIKEREKLLSFAKVCMHAALISELRRPLSMTGTMHPLR